MSLGGQSLEEKIEESTSDLRKKASKQDIPGRSKMGHDELAATVDHRELIFTMLALRDLLISSDPLACRRPGFRAGDKLVRSWPKRQVQYGGQLVPFGLETVESPDPGTSTLRAEDVVLWGDLQLFVGLPGGARRQSAAFPLPD